MDASCDTPGRRRWQQTPRFLKKLKALRSHGAPGRRRWQQTSSPKSRGSFQLHPAQPTATATDISDQNSSAKEASLHTPVNYFKRLPLSKHRIFIIKLQEPPLSLTAFPPPYIKKFARIATQTKMSILQEAQPLHCNVTRKIKCVPAHMNC